MTHNWIKIRHNLDRCMNCKRWRVTSKSLVNTTGYQTKYLRHLGEEIEHNALSCQPTGDANATLQR